MLSIRDLPVVQINAVRQHHKWFKLTQKLHDVSRIIYN